LIDLGDLVAHSDPRQDEYLENPEEDDDASDVEDIIIKPTDNLLLVGHVEGEASILEVYGRESLTLYQNSLLTDSNFDNSSLQ
jgi:hypothetical protein